MTQPLTAAALIKNFNLMLADSRADFAMIENAILGQGYIVMSGELALNFNIENKYVSGIAGRTRAGLAPRFTKEDAEKIAATVTNGRGEVGRAIHVRHAIQDEIARIEAVISSLQATVKIGDTVQVGGSDGSVGKVKSFDGQQSQVRADVVFPDGSSSTETLDRLSLV